MRLAFAATLVLAMAASRLSVPIANAQELTSNKVVQYLGATSLFTTNLTTTGGQPALIALDNQGNVIFADVTNGTVARIPLLGDPPVTLLTGLSSITAIAADANGNVFVAARNLNHLIKVSSGSGSTSQLGNGFNGPSSLTLDPQGNIIVADKGNNRVVRVAANGSQAVLHTVESPTAVYMDSSGDLFVGSAAGITAYWFNGQVYPIGQGWSQPTSITKAGNANLFVVDSGKHQLIEVVASTGKQQILSDATDVRAVTSISGDDLGNLYAYDAIGAQIMKLDAQINLGSAAVGTQTMQYTLAYEFEATTTLASISALTQGSPDGQLAIIGGSCFIDYVYQAGDSCTVVIAGVMNRGGSWNGDVTLIDNNGNDLYDAEVFAIGLAPVQVLIPGRAQTYYRNQYSYTGELIPAALAVDSADNLYIGDDANARVLEVGSDGAAQVLFDGVAGHPLGDPLALTLDGKGNLFVADASLAWGLGPVPGAAGSLKSNVFFAIPYGQWGPNQSFVSFMTSLLVQPNGGFFFSDSGNNRVIAVDNTGTGVELLPASLPIGPAGLTLGYPMGLAYSKDGSLLVLDFDNNRIVKRTTAGVVSEAVPPGMVLAGQALAAPMGIVVDPAGNLYISDTGNNRVVGLTPQGQSWVILDSKSLIDGSVDVPLDNPQTLALDSSGNLFVADVGNERVVKIDRLTQNVVFDQTNIGLQSTPIQVSVQNIGNESLVVQSVAMTAPNGAFGLTSSTTCSSHTALAVNDSCGLYIQYSPTTAVSSFGELSLNSNTQGVAGASTVIDLVGLSSVAVDHFRLANLPTTVEAGVPFSYVLRAEDIQGGLVTGYRGSVQVSWSDKTSPPSTYSFNANDDGSHTFAGVILQHAGITTLQAQDIANVFLSTNGATNVYAAAAAVLTSISGSGQSAIVGQAFSQPLVLSAHDIFGNLVAGASITFTAPANGASAVDSDGDRVIEVLTDSTGTGYAYLVANQVAGDYRLMASLASTTSTPFSLSNLTAAPINPVPPVAPAGSFTIVASPSLTAFNSAGTALSALAIKQINGFQGAIVLKCVVPSGITCSLSRVALEISDTSRGASAPLIPYITVTMHSSTGTVAQSLLSYGYGRTASALAILFGFFLLPKINKSRSFFRMSMALVLLAASLGGIGCGAPASGRDSAKPVLIRIIAQATPLHGVTVLTKSVLITVDPYVEAVVAPRGPGPRPR